MTIKRVKLSETLKRKGKSREELLKNMTEEEIKRRAEMDPDNPILSEDKMKKFQLAKNREKSDVKKD